MVYIEDIRWNRSFLELYYKDQKCSSLYLYNEKTQQFIPFECEQSSDSFVARLNIALAGGREVLPEGEWIICLSNDECEGVPNPKTDDSPLQSNTRNESFSDGDKLYREHGGAYSRPFDVSSISYKEEILSDLVNYSVVYRYAKRSYAYTISFLAQLNEDNAVYLAIQPEFFKRNDNPKVRAKSKTYLLKQAMRLLFGCFSHLFRYQRKGNSILFLKENGDRPTENMAALQVRMKERGLEERFKIRSSYRNVFNGRQSIFGWLKDLVLVSKSSYIFIDDYAPIFNFIEPDSDTCLVQLWHAGVGFKSVGYARFGIDGSPDPYASCHREYTYALIGNAGLREIYSEVFGIEKEALLATGMPRLDHFLDSSVMDTVREKLYDRYPVLRQGRVILFAPTYRGQGQREAYYPYDCFEMDSLYEMCVRTNSFFVFEMHHFITQKPPIDEKYSDRIFDLSHESINELFYVTDVLITDYSSCFYDFLLLKKPIVFFTPDRGAYTAIRGVQRPIANMAPGVVCDTFSSLIEALDKKLYEAVAPDASMIDRASEMGMYASDRAIDTILFKKDIPGVRLTKE